MGEDSLGEYGDKLQAIKKGRSGSHAPAWEPFLDVFSWERGMHSHAGAWERVVPTGLGIGAIAKGGFAVEF